MPAASALQRSSFSPGTKGAYSVTRSSSPAYFGAWAVRPTCPLGQIPPTSHRRSRAISRSTVHVKPGATTARRPRPIRDVPIPPGMTAWKHRRILARAPSRALCRRSLRTQHRVGCVGFRRDQDELARLLFGFASDQLCDIRINVRQVVVRHESASWAIVFSSLHLGAGRQEGQRNGNSLENQRHLGGLFQGECPFKGFFQRHFLDFKIRRETEAHLAVLEGERLLFH